VRSIPKIQNGLIKRLRASSNMRLVTNLRFKAVGSIS
jgi:hypothetical protein